MVETVYYSPYSLVYDLSYNEFIFGLLSGLLCQSEDGNTSLESINIGALVKLGPLVMP